MTDSYGDSEVLPISPETQEYIRDQNHKRKIADLAVSTLQAQESSNGLPIFFLKQVQTGAISPEHYQARAARPISDRKTALAQQITRTEVVPEEYKRYVELLAEASVVLDGGIDIVMMSNIAQYCKNIQYAEEYLGMAQQWQSILAALPETERPQYPSADFNPIYTNIIIASEPRHRSNAAILSSVEKNMLATSLMQELAILYSSTEEISRKDFAYLKGTLINRGIENYSNYRDVWQLEQNQIILKGAVEAGLDKQKVLEFINSIQYYFASHRIEPGEAEAIVKNVLPKFLHNDPDSQRGNVHAIKEGDYGVIDFMIAAESLKVKPRQISVLLAALHEVPTSNMARLNQNRIDAIALSKTFGGLKDFIHDQRPGVNELMLKMITFYETKDNSELEKLLPTLDKDYFQEGYNIFKILDLNNYDLLVKPGKTSEQMPIIEVLRRIEYNTRPVYEEPPVTQYKVINEALTYAHASQNVDGIFFVTSLLNQQILSDIAQGKFGIGKEMVLSIAWLEQQQFKLLQRLRYEEQVDAYKQPWFKELLRFNQLTASMQYSVDEFENFYTSIENLPTQQAYLTIAQRTLRNVEDLSKYFTERNKPDWAEAQWSGNVTDQLIGLVDLRPAQTAVGKRLRSEQATPEDLRVWGD